MSRFGLQNKKAINQENTSSLDFDTPRASLDDEISAYEYMAFGCVADSLYHAPLQLGTARSFENSSIKSGLSHNNMTTWDETCSLFWLEEEASCEVPFPLREKQISIIDTADSTMSPAGCIDCSASSHK